MGDANCPECGGGYTCEQWVSDGDVVTATCIKCGAEFDVEASVSFNMA